MEAGNPTGFFTFITMIKNIECIIFDVNETLLDLSPLKNSINSALGKGAAEVWFSQLLHYSLVESITGTYHDFSEIALAVLKMNVQKADLDLSESDLQDILSPISKLKAYPDVEKGLDQLKKAGYRIIAFSNGKPSVLNEQLKFAGLTTCFDQILSVDEIKKYKPHPEAYKYALRKTNSKAESSMMVAAHGWDIAGAQRAGLKTAFIERPGKFIFPLAEKPTLETNSILELSKLLTGD